MSQATLKDKNILVGVTGSIAIYKTLELIRLYIKSGANVRVIMTNAAKRFITPLTFETISQNRVLDETSESWADEFNHIGMGKWADIFVLAPCSANTINKLSNGIADNLLTQSALAYPGVKILAPAANTNMIKNPFTQASLKMLNLCNYKIIKPVVKELACKDIGEGAMAEVEDIFFATAKELLRDEYWSDRKVVVSGGGTIEKIDDVRYISNFSSGKMAASIATALYLKGADVCLVATRGLEDAPKGVHKIKVETSEEMNLFLIDSIRVAKKGKMSEASLMDDSPQKLIQKKPYLFMAAAISDYLPKFPQSGKIKKSDIGELWDVRLEQNIDILNSLNKEGIYSIGFKAETDEKIAQENAKAMLENKDLDAVCLNVLNDRNNFGSTMNEIELFTKTSSTLLEMGDKLDISFELLELLKEEFNES